jgi:hypothetical protein
MRYILPGFAVLLLCLAPNLPGAHHDAFVGSWQLDTANTPAIDGKQVTSAALNVEYQHKMIHLSKSINFTNGDKTVVEEWKLDHRYHPVTSGGTGEFLAKWQGPTALTAEHEMDGSHENISLVLSPDGRTLTETVHRTGSSGDYNRTLVWKRQ